MVHYQVNLVKMGPKSVVCTCSAKKLLTNKWLKILFYNLNMHAFPVHLTDIFQKICTCRVWTIKHLKYILVHEKTAGFQPASSTVIILMSRDCVKRRHSVEIISNEGNLGEDYNCKIYNITIVRSTTAMLRSAVNNTPYSYYGMQFSHYGMQFGYYGMQVGYYGMQSGYYTMEYSMDLYLASSWTCCMRTG